MLLGDKSMAISAVNTCFWRVKSRKQGCMTTQKTHKQLRVSEIQKLRMLGIFAPTRWVGYLHAKYEETRCQEKNSFARPSIRLIEAHWNEINRGFFYAALEYFVLPEWPHILPKKESPRVGLLPLGTSSLYIFGKALFTFTKQPDSWL